MVSMVLHQVLSELESAKGPVDLNELGRKLGVERSALDGMIAFWVRKGRLHEGCLAARLHKDTDAGCGSSCSACRSVPR